jgi:hypothetical protein
MGTNILEELAASILMLSVKIIWEVAGYIGAEKDEDGRRERKNKMG